MPQIIKWWGKQKYWLKGAVIGFIFSILVYEAFGIYDYIREGTWICGSFGGSSPCSFGSYVLVSTVQFFTILIPFPLLLTLVGVIISFIIGKIKKVK